MTKILALSTILLFAAIHPAEASTVYSLTFDTTNFDLSGNPYDIDVNLTAANGVGDATFVTLDDFICTGCPSTAQTLDDSSFSQDLYIPFTAGGPVSFDLTLSVDLSGLSSFGPDSLQLSLLDQYANPITTTDPYDALVFYTLDSASPVASVFGSPANGSPTFDAPVVEEIPSSTPEPNSAWLSLAALGAVAIVRRRIR